MKERKKATAVVAARYQKASKKDKGIILNEFTELIITRLQRKLYKLNAQKRSQKKEPAA